MSEEILKALTQLFAIITKQDDGVSENERGFVIRFFQQELDHDSIKDYVELYDSYSEYKKQNTVEKPAKLTSVKDSVKTLGICRKINKTLTQKQKVVVVIKLLELVGSDKNFTAQRMEIINTASTVFNIREAEYKLIESFIIADSIAQLDHAAILVVNNKTDNTLTNQKRNHAHLEGNMIFIHVKSVDMYFVRYQGNENHSMNGFAMQPGRVYLFSHGSTIRMQQGDAVYYSDLIANFNEEIKTTKLLFNAQIDEYKFANQAIGLRNVLITEGPGKLIGIMGASGAGKTTLLNVMAGLERPSKGKILINGFDIHSQKNKIHGVIGYVSQDDLLIEELTVYQNLYFNAQLCFSNFSNNDLDQRVMKVLADLGLDQRKDLRVGGVLDKTISGGQRKRLNIALELIREPAVLFLDEPTSGLSSRDSENVIDLLKELSLKGKLIFVVIHQPSSDIYKMFDKMIIMDTGGYPAYYGAPVEAVSYFKKATHQVDSNRGQCESCGNVNPEQIFNIIEAKVVDEYGQPTNKRKVSPVQWHDMFLEKFKAPMSEDVTEEPPKTLSLPNALMQSIIFAKRDFLSKISNKQYLLINLLEAPLLAFILTFIIRYRSDPSGAVYIFRFNDNFPAYLLMSIIVALFMGLTVSAEEIIRDRKILKRESFLNLNWSSYLFSKVGILFTLSAIQTLLFVAIGNFMLNIHGMILPFWFVLFTTSCMANILGLNISSAFNSAVTVYVLIPLLLIPQMVLSGLLFDFEKLNQFISSKGKVPLLADMMASRWAYEAMACYQFINNDYQRLFYEYERKQSQADFKSAYLAAELRKKIIYISENLMAQDELTKETLAYEKKIVVMKLINDPLLDSAPYAEIKTHLANFKFDNKFCATLQTFIDQYQRHYQKVYNENVVIAERKMSYYEKKGWIINENKNLYYNESLADLVKNINTKERLIEYKGDLIQKIYPIFQEPEPIGSLDYRTAFFYPIKKFLGITWSTFWFNLLVIWMMCLVLFIALYFEWLHKLMNAFSKVPDKLKIDMKLKTKEIK